MKHFTIKLAVLACISLSSLNAQVFWTEDFGTGCNKGQKADSYTGTNGSWTAVSTGINNAASNLWFVSATEKGGLNNGDCNLTGCGGANNRTLHIGNRAVILDFGWGPIEFLAADMSAAYNAGDNTNITNIRAESPTIDCTGKSNIEVEFLYVEKGDGAKDEATLWYYDGTAWAQIDGLPKTTSCTGTTAQWTLRTISLPASADNNANVKIGFNWTNNGDGIGNDPSIAIDYLTLSGDDAPSFALPVTWIDFSGELMAEQNAIQLNWSTASELNNDYFTIQKSKDGVTFTDFIKVPGVGNSSEVNDYSVIDRQPNFGVNYYRVSQTDYDGKSKTYKNWVVIENNSQEVQLYPNPNDGRYMEIKLSVENKMDSKIQILDGVGNTVYERNYSLNKGVNELIIQPTFQPRKGVYFIQIDTGNGVQTKKWIVN